MLKSDQRGFTLIEMLLVMVIMGIMLAVIVPRAWRANVDSKYTLCRQNCTELAKYTQEWCESMLLAQTETSASTLDDYYRVLMRNTADGQATYVATSANTYWSSNGANTRNVTGRAGDPETTVSVTAPQDKRMRNPFTGADVFALANYPYNAPVGPIAGAIAYAGFTETAATGTAGYHYYAFLFQGTDNTVYLRNNDDSFHAGMGPTTMGGVRNGVFVARMR
ncbi:MAG: type II secretion system protein [Deltaproteobacteria bacterium]|nr:type II secretion system protein [Candidatus Tharpella sp.]